MRHDEIIENLVCVLKSSNIYQDSIGIKELRIGRGSVRADLAVFGKQLVGFELKSRFDSVRRLPIQLDQYDRFFEFTIVVCDPRHTKKVFDIADIKVGIWEMTTVPDRFNVVREPKRSSNISKETLLEPLWRDDLLTAVAAINPGFKAIRAPRADLRSFLSEQMSVSDVKNLVGSVLQARDTIRPRRYDLGQK